MHWQLDDETRTSTKYRLISSGLPVSCTLCCCGPPYDQASSMIIALYQLVSSGLPVSYTLWYHESPMSKPVPWSYLVSDGVSWYLLVYQCFDALCCQWQLDDETRASTKYRLISSGLPESGTLCYNNDQANSMIIALCQLVSSGLPESGTLCYNNDQANSMIIALCQLVSSGLPESGTLCYNNDQANSMIIALCQLVSSGLPESCTFSCQCQFADDNICTVSAHLFWCTGILYRLLCMSPWFVEADHEMFLTRYKLHGSVVDCNSYLPVIQQ